ncbi:PLDc N-terminal domain-containing protein [Clavibacter sp. Sh2141]|uniref:PLDc N-terminal domain-containing protein n=1 Tax=Clavibacter sp. Sh2141 TaxID=3395374 RepID=UPI0039BD5B09
MGSLTAWHTIIIGIVLALDLVALVQVTRDPRRSRTAKVVWSLVIVLLPLVGFVGWLIDLMLGAATRGLDRRNARVLR